MSPPVDYVLPISKRPTLSLVSMSPDFILAAFMLQPPGPYNELHNFCRNLIRIAQCADELRLRRVVSQRRLPARLAAGHMECWHQQLPSQQCQHWGRGLVYISAGRAAVWGRELGVLF